MISVEYSLSGFRYHHAKRLLDDLNLIKGDVGHPLVFDYTNFKTKSNKIKFKVDFDVFDDALELFNIVRSVDFRKTKSTNRYCKPMFRLSLEIVDKEYGK